MTVTKRAYRNVYLMPLGVILLCGVAVIPAMAQQSRNEQALPSIVGSAAPASSSKIQPKTQADSSSVEIDTSVLGGLRNSTYQPAPYAPRSQQLQLHKPTSTGNDWLTTGIEPDDDITAPMKQDDDYIIMPRQQHPTIKSKQLENRQLRKAREEEPDIIPGQSSAIDDAPRPDRKPVEAIKAAKAERLARVPIPERRPVIQQASKSFVTQKRLHIAEAIPSDRLVPPTVRKTAPMDPRILQNAPRSMPAEPSQDVAVEPLHTEDKVVIARNSTVQADNARSVERPTSFTARMNAHKNRIIEAVQKIAGYRDEPDIDVNSYMANRQELAVALNDKNIEKPNLQRIDAKPLSKDMARIEPAAGTEAKLIHTPATRKTQATDGRMISVAFAPTQAAIDKDIKAAVNTKILPRMQTDNNLRIQLQSYASSPDETNSLAARRLSLSRALAAREYLVSMGIDPRRIDLRPMGESTQAGTADRIDFLIYKP